MVGYPSRELCLIDPQGPCGLFGREEAAIVDGSLFCDEPFEVVGTRAGLRVGNAAELGQVGRLVRG